MDWIAGEPLRFDCPLFADELLGRQTFECLQPSPEIVGSDEVGEVISQLIVVVVMEAFDSGVLDCPVHPLDLAIRPGVFDLGEPVLDLMLAANAAEDVLEGVKVAFVIGELNAVVGQHNIDGVRHGCNQVAQERSSGHFAGLRVQFHIDKLGGAVDGNEEIQLPFCCLNLGNIDVKVAQRVGFEILFYRLVAIDVGQPTDIVTLQTAMQ